FGRVGESECLERNHKLGDPPIVMDADVNIPHSVPFLIYLAVVGYPPVPLGARWIRRDEESGAIIIQRVEDNADFVSKVAGEIPFQAIDDHVLDFFFETR